MRYLLDTNMVVAWQTRRSMPVIRRLVASRREVGLSSIVAYELFFGAFNSSQPGENLGQVDEIGFQLVPFDDSDARAAGEIRAKMKRAGQPIGPYDLLIAGQALARDLIVVTANLREFTRVEGLKVENWAVSNG